MDSRKPYYRGIFQGPTVFYRCQNPNDLRFDRGSRVLPMRPLRAPVLLADLLATKGGFENSRCFKILEPGIIIPNMMKNMKHHDTKYIQYIYIWWKTWNIWWNLTNNQIYCLKKRIEEYKLDLLEDNYGLMCLWNQSTNGDLTIKQRDLSTCDMCRDLEYFGVWVMPRTERRGWTSMNTDVEVWSQKSKIANHVSLCV